MNQVQKKLFEIYLAFAKACEMLGIKFFADGGTLLGAVRHKGFIPWDDDMDFSMFREDYNRFVREGAQYLPAHLLIQCIETDKEYPFPYMKIRDTKTTMVEKKLENASFNQGCWIDVFPLDEIDPLIDGSPKRQRRRQLLTERALLRFEPKRIQNFHVFLYRLKLLILFPSRARARQKLNSFYSAPKRHSDFLAANFGRLTANQILLKKWFANSISVEFEEGMVPIPAGYLPFLERVYGDWKRLPPESERVGTHDCVVDLNSPFPTLKKRSCFPRVFRKHQSCKSEK